MSTANPPMNAPTPAVSPRFLRTALSALVVATAAVWFGSRSLLNANFLPHWYCLVGNRRLLWTTVVSDLAIGISYVIISSTLVLLIRRAGRDLPYTHFFWAFGLFIVSCGATHFFEVVTVWYPIYWLSAAVKVITAAASAGTAIVLLVAADDIVGFIRTAREAATLRGSERFRALVEAAPMAVIGFDSNGVVQHWNRSAERIFEIAAGDAVGRPPAIIPAELRAEHESLLQTTLAGTTTISHETKRARSDGTAIPVKISAAPVYDENNALSGVMAVIEDVSRQTALEEEGRRLEAQIRQAQKMEVLGRLAGGVAHDFNNMLMILGSCSELLERSLSPDSSARIYVDQIRRATEKAAVVTKQLLAFSRKQVLELRPMDLHGALNESEFMLTRLLGSDIELSFRHEAGHSWILSDPAQIEQVVANLTINSRDAMPSGGHLTISTRNATTLPEDGLSVTKPRDEWVVLEVADTGCGMDEKTRAQMFEPFFTTKPAGKGTGLGLASVYGIVKQSGGHIRVETAPGKGTRFELYFPVVEPVISEAVSTAPGVTAASNDDRITILVADDEAALRHAVVELLRGSGYTVLEANSALVAAEIAKQHTGKIDILLTDIVMPGLRGNDLARRVVSFHPAIQVIYMSGYAEGFPEAEIPSNASFLQKPFRFATLLEQLKLIRHKS